MSQSEAYTPLNGSGGNSAPFDGSGGRRRSKKLRMVKKSTIRRMLRSKGLKMRGGNHDVGEGMAGEMGKAGGRRRRRGRSTRRPRSLFGVMKY
jgi:hypothetical protein